MPQVRKQKKSKRGVRKCGRCGHEIQPGEEYFVWSFRYGGTQVRCIEHPPKRSELTQSKLATIYEAIEDAGNNLGSLEETKEAVIQVAEAVRDVAAEYEEAAQNFGQAGENQDRAEELNAWADELEEFEPEESSEEFDEEKFDEEAKELSESEDISYGAAMQQIRDDWEANREEEMNEAEETAREEARELLSQCPL